MKRSSRAAIVIAFTTIADGSGAHLLAAGDQPGPPAPPPKAATTKGRVECRIDPDKSRFMVETQTTGLSAMFAHDHKMQFAEFSGTASYNPGALSTGASLQMNVKARSLHLIEDQSVGEAQAIESVLRKEVLETEKYPEITFKTASVFSERRGDGTYDIRLTGDLTLHGVRRRITIPARVAIDPDGIHAIGLFEIKQTDFKITPFSFVGGTVAIRDQVIISFDIVAPWVPS